MLGPDSSDSSMTASYIGMRLWRIQGTSKAAHECRLNLRWRRIAVRRSEWWLVGAKGGLTSSRNGSDVDEVDARGHTLRKTGIEGADLRVYVGEEREAGPSTNFHNERVVDSLEF